MRGGKREGSGRKSRKLGTVKISAYTPDRELLNSISEQTKIPVVELLHQLLKHKDFYKIIDDIKSSKEVIELYKKD